MTAAKEVIIDTPYGKARHPLTNTNPAPTPPASELRQIPLNELVESPWNPRKHFDPAKLAEMADSLRKGQHAPIIVRPTDMRLASTTRYEIGAGHRRFRSAPAAGLTSLLAIVRDLDDVAFLELLTIENKQREDVAPLDEANGFKLLMEKAGYDVAKLAARIGLSTKYVYDRIKLLQLIPEIKKYLEDGTITAGHAILLARLTPDQQRKVMGNPSRMNRYGYRDGTGLFQPEHADHDPDQPALELKQPIKARSVREVATYINDHVRFDPTKNDLPNLFPSAAVALEEAKTDDLAPVYITHDHQLKFDAKDHKVRTYGVMSWRRADGKKKSKICAWSRIGIVAAGRDRGDAFRVCVNRDKCDVHFKAARAASKRRAADRAKYATSDEGSSNQDDYWARETKKREREEAKRKESNARWAKAAPTLLTMLAKAMKKLPAGAKSVIGKYLLDDTDAMPWDDGTAKKYLPIGTTADELVRHIVFAHLAGDIHEPYDGGKQATENYKAFGINAKRVLDELAPVEKPAKKPAPKKSKKGAH